MGPNGAGKTSLFGLISGDLTPSAGQVSFAGRNITRLDSAARCRLGIGRTYQVPRPFTDMTVFENVLVAAQQGGGLRRKASYAAAAAALERTGIAGEANVPAGLLGLLARKRLEIARALATGPQLLLLDEVAGGLTDPEVTVLVEIVRAINAEGIAVIWIEHVVRALTSLVARMTCLYGGEFIGDGTPAEVLANPRVREVYLGSRPTTRRSTGRAAKRKRPHEPEKKDPNDRMTCSRTDPGPPSAGGRVAAARGPRPGRAPRPAAGAVGHLADGVPGRGVRDHRRQRRRASPRCCAPSPACTTRPTGTIRYDGRDMTGLRPEKRATAGIGMVPEGRRLFPSLSLEENLKVGATYARKGPWNIGRVFELFPWMKDRRGQKTAQMSGGEQQSVAIGRALVANPRVLLLDELSLGLAPVIVQRIYAMLPQILESGITVLLVEQDVSQALRVATHLQCLLEGHTTLEGTPAEVTRDQVEAAYFGVTDGSQPLNGLG